MWNEMNLLVKLSHKVGNCFCRRESLIATVYLWHYLILSYASACLTSFYQKAVSAWSGRYRYTRSGECLMTSRRWLCLILTPLKDWCDSKRWYQLALFNLHRMHLHLTAHWREMLIFTRITFYAVLCWTSLTEHPWNEYFTNIEDHHGFSLRKASCSSDGVGLPLCLKVALIQLNEMLFVRRTSPSWPGRLGL